MMKINRLMEDKLKKLDINAIDKIVLPTELQAIFQKGLLKKIIVFFLNFFL